MIGTMDCLGLKTARGLFGGKGLLILLAAALMGFGSSEALAYTPAPDGYLDAAAFGPGFNATDATAALQGAIDTGQNVWVPNMGTDWIVNPIAVTNSNQEIFFEPGVVVMAKAEDGFTLANYCLFRVDGGSSNRLVGYGATFRMRQQDYLNPPYQPSEGRHAIKVKQASNVEILGLTIEDTGGDGIIVQGKYPYDNWSENVLIKDVTINNAYRNGISIISVQNLLIDNVVIINTSGTLPEAGIDFEPSNSAERIVNAVVRNTIIYNNDWSGIHFWVANELSGVQVTGSIENVTIIGNGYDPDGVWDGDGIFMTDGLPGFEIKDSLFIDNNSHGVDLDEPWTTFQYQDIDYSGFWGNGDGPVGGLARLGTGNVTGVEPVFVSTDPNDPFFMYLADVPENAPFINGASDGSYMGARGVVPEPATMALLGVGGLLAMLRRRRYA